MEKQRQLKNTITQLKTDEGLIENEPEKILKEIENFYSNLYKTNNSDKKKVHEYINRCEIDYRLNER